MRRGTSLVAAAAGGAGALTLSLWLPWFTRRVSALVAPLAADRSVSGWAALDEMGLVLVAAAAVAVAWALTRLPAFWLVVAGAAALLTEVAVTVQRVDTAEPDLATTSPAAGLLLAYAGAAAIVLVGLIALMADARRRAEAARTT